MNKRDEQRRQADRDFEEIRQTIAAQSDEWLCEALNEIPHRKWMAIEKDVQVAVGILAHRAAARIAELQKALEEIEDNCNGYGDIAGWACKRAAKALRPDSAL